MIILGFLIGVVLPNIGIVFLFWVSQKYFGLSLDNSPLSKITFIKLLLR